MRARALLDVAERLGASFLFGEAFFADSGGDHHFRLALTAVTRDEIGEGIRRIGQAMATLRASRLAPRMTEHFFPGTPGTGGMRYRGAACAIRITRSSVN